jgi:hypothetical protein
MLPSQPNAVIELLAAALARRRVMDAGRYRYSNFATLATAVA